MDKRMEDLFLKLEDLIERKKKSRRQIEMMTNAIPGLSAKIGRNYSKLISLKSISERTDLVAQSLTKLLNIEKPIKKFGKKNISRNKMNFEGKNALAKEEIPTNYQYAPVGEEDNYEDTPEEDNHEDTPVEGQVEDNYENDSAKEEIQVSHKNVAVGEKAEVNFEKASGKKIDWNKIIEEEKLKERSRSSASI